jgi:hypothetical protein
MRLKKALICSAIFALEAFAQGPRAGMPGPGIRFLGAAPGRPGQVVKGAPYTADISTEFTQVLGDGNRIHQVTGERVYRDSEGRTRRETSLTGLGSGGESGVPLAFVDDPVAGSSFVLDLNQRTVTRMPSRQAAANPAPTSASPRNRPARAANPNLKTESLGRQTIAGIVADGTRTTQTIPAGQIGNSLPIQVVSERWYSADLQAVILQKRSDPRSGETVSQWTNISRAEPPSTLFVVPADFQASQGPAPRLRGMRSGSSQ